MARYRTSRILPTILTIVVIIIAIAGLVALARLLFSGGNSSGSTTVNQTDLNKQALVDTADGRAVSMTVRGPIVAQEDFRSYQIIISPNTRDFNAYTGYLNTITSQQTLSNNTAAYTQFVNALNKANMAAGTPFDADKKTILKVFVLPEEDTNFVHFLVASNRLCGGLQPVADLPGL